MLFDNLKLYPTVLFFAAVVISGCAAQQTIEPKIASLRNDAKKAVIEEKASKLKDIFETINERNRTLKKSPEWLNEAYSEIKIKNLNELPETEFASYRKYLLQDDIYIVVHPGYYVFFHKDEKKASVEQKLKLEESALPFKNLTERYADKMAPDDINLKVMIEQERLLREFLEFMSEQKKLVILVLPKDYKEHMTYGYSPGRDEYARYINELTNTSESILYVESQTHDNGYLRENDLKKLSVFINKVGAGRMMLGGGYLGKCLDNFYVSARKIFNHEHIYFVMDITTISPDDMSSDRSKLLTDKGRINYKAMQKYYNLSGSEGLKGNETLKLKRLTAYGSL